MSIHLELDDVCSEHQPDVVSSLQRRSICVSEPRRSNLERRVGGTLGGSRKPARSIRSSRACRVVVNWLEATDGLRALVLRIEVLPGEWPARNEAPIPAPRNRACRAGGTSLPRNVCCPPAFEAGRCPTHRTSVRSSCLRTTAARPRPESIPPPSNTTTRAGWFGELQRDGDAGSSRPDDAEIAMHDLACRNRTRIDQHG